MADFTLKRNDTRPAMDVSITRGGAAQTLASTAQWPLNASLVKLLIKEDAGAIAWNATMSIASAAGGVARWTPVPSQTATAAVLQMEYEVTWSDGGVETFPEDGYHSLDIKADLG